MVDDSPTNFFEKKKECLIFQIVWQKCVERTVGYVEKN